LQRKWKTRALCSITFFLENLAVYEMSKNVVVTEWPQVTPNMAHTNFMLDKQGYIHARPCTRPRARADERTHSQIFIAFPRQQ
jgi:hypothetical protein